MFKRTIAALTVLAALLCLTVKVDAAKLSPDVKIFIGRALSSEAARQLPTD